LLRVLEDENGVSARTIGRRHKADDAALAAARAQQTRSRRQPPTRSRRATAPGCRPGRRPQPLAERRKPTRLLGASS
jgi:hypothetical protein